VEEAQSMVERVDVEDLRTFQKLTERLKTEERVCRILAQQSEDNKKAMFDDMLPYCAEGTPLLLKYTSADPYAPSDLDRQELQQESVAQPPGGPEAAILLAPYDPSQILDATTPNYFVCLTERNRIRMVTPKDVLDIDTEAALVALGEDLTAEQIIDTLPAKRKWTKAGVDSFITAGNGRTQAVSDSIPSLVDPGMPFQTCQNSQNSSVWCLRLRVVDVLGH